MKTQVSELIDARGFESRLFHYSIAQDNVVNTSKFTSAGQADDPSYSLTSLEDEQRAKCGGVVGGR
jgi:hypothetical protein